MPTYDNMVRMMLTGSSGEGSDLLASDFAEKISALCTAFSETHKIIAAEATEEALASAVLYLRSTEMNSPAKITCEVAEIERPWELISEVEENVQAIQHDDTVPEYFTRELAKCYQRLAPKSNNGLASVVVFFSDRKPVTITHRYRAIIEDWLNAQKRPDYTALGTLKGRLEKTNVHGSKSECTIYPFVGTDKVECTFDRDVVEEIGKALDKKVLAKGLLRYRHDARHPYKMEIRSLEILPDDESLPSLAEVLKLGRSIGSKRKGGAQPGWSNG